MTGERDTATKHGSVLPRPNYQADVAEFTRDVCGLPTPSSPTLDGYPFELRANLILEEAHEFCEAAGCWVDSTGKANQLLRGKVDQAKMIDAICDIVYVAIGAAVQMGVDLDPFWRAVHASNMAKVNGPVSPEGKRLKPEGWVGPDIEGILKRMKKDRG